MAANFLSIKMNEFLAKIQKPSKTERYLRKLSRMGVTMNLLIETNAVEIVKSFSSHPQVGALAIQIIREWNEEVTPVSSSSSIPTSSDESCDSVDSVHTGGRRISHCKPAIKKATVEVDSDYWEYSDDEDEKYYRRFSDRVDDAIRKNRLPHPSHPSYAGALADFMYGNEEKKNPQLSIPVKSRNNRANKPAPIKKFTKTIKKQTPLMNKALKMAGRK